MPQPHAAPVPGEAESKNSTNEIAYYRADQRLDPALVRELITPQIEDKLREVLEEGESALIQGSTPGHFLKHTGPIIWSKAGAAHRSDVDINLFGPRSIAKCKREGPYLLSKGKTDEGVRFEIVDGQKITEDIRHIASDVQLQAVGQYYQAGEDNMTRERAKDLFLRAGEIVDMVDADQELAIMLNNTLRETAVGIRVEKVAGELQYYVSDPLNVLDDFLGINEQVSEWKGAQGVAAGIPSVGMPEVGIHRLVMHTVIAFGSIETKVPLALNAPRRIARLPFDETMNGIAISCDGIRAKALQDRGELVTVLGANILGIDDFLSMQAFLASIQKQPQYTAMSEGEVATAKGVEGHEEYIRRSAQVEFARCARYAVEKTIFYYFSYLPIGGYVNPAFNDSLQTLRETLKGIPQNTLDQYMWWNMFSSMLPKEALAAREDLHILENIQAACQQLYPLEIVHSIPEVEQGAEALLPVYRQKRSPQSISEVMALLYVCSGNVNPTTDELQTLCDNWLPQGAVESAFDIDATDFSMDISVTAIREHIRTLSKIVNLPHKKHQLSVEQSGEPLGNNSQPLGRFDRVVDSLRRIAQLVSNA